MSEYSTQEFELSDGAVSRVAAAARPLHRSRPTTRAPVLWTEIAPCLSAREQPGLKASSDLWQLGGLARRRAGTPASPVETEDPLVMSQR